MSRYSCAPENMSLLNPNEFKFYVEKAPYLSFFVQAVSLPSVNLIPVESATPFTSLVTSGDHIDWEQLSIVFAVDEDLNGWRECFNWMRGLGFPNSFEEYKALVNSVDYTSLSAATSSHISVVTNTGSRNNNIEYLFFDAIPTMISAPTLTTTNTGQPIVTAKVMFSYREYIVQPIHPELPKVVSPIPSTLLATMLL